jgi:hypothetical protein
MPREFNKQTTRVGWKAEKNNNDRENAANSNVGLPRHGADAFDDIITHPSEYEALDSFPTYGERRRGGNRNPPSALSKPVSVVVVTADKKSLQKQLQKLIRKLQEINDLECAKVKGKELNLEQQKKLDSKSQVEGELAQVQSALQ